MHIALNYGGLHLGDITTINEQLEKYKKTLDSLKLQCGIDATGHVFDGGNQGYGVCLNLDGYPQGLKDAVEFCIENLGYPTELPVFRKECKLFKKILAEKGVKPVRFAGHLVYIPVDENGGM